MTYSSGQGGSLRGGGGGGVGGCQLLRCVLTKASSRRACAEGLSAGFLGEREGRVHSWVACVGALLSPDEAAHGEGSEGGREVTGGSRDGLANADLEHGRLGWQLRPEREAGRWLVRGALPLAMVATPTTHQGGPTPHPPWWLGGGHFVHGAPEAPDV